MALPKIDLPLFEITIPSTGKKTKFRPFTVKEEKILLIAQESKDQKQIVLAIKQIINNCLNNVDVESLAVFDLQYLLLNIRAKSVNNEITFNITDPDTNESIELTFDINTIEIKKDPSHNRLIKVTDDISINMSYPNSDTLEFIAGEGESKPMFDVISNCIESVIQGDVVYKLKDFSKKEVNEFVESLSSDVIVRIKEFFDTMPVLRYEKIYKNKNGVEKKFVIEGMETFFI